VINQATGAVGSTLKHIESTEPAREGSIGQLVQALNGGTVDTLIVIGGNPAYNAPADLEFGTVMKRAGTVIRLGAYEDETSALSTWHINRAHYLESWGDARTADGTVVPVQPLIEPLLGGVADLEVLARVLGVSQPAAREVVRATISQLGTDESGWQKFLHDGHLQASAASAVQAQFQAAPVVRALRNAAVPDGVDFDLVLFRDASVDDGRFNNNGWLQEMPDPVTKVTWENVLLVSIKTARALGVESSDRAKSGQFHQNVLRVMIGDRTVEGPVWIQPGMADNTVGIALGYGRKKTGRVGTACGVDAYPLYLHGSRHVATGVKVEKIFKKSLVAVTQEHGLMEGRPVIREANLAQFEEKPDFAKHMDLDAHLPHYVPAKTKPDGRNPGRLQNIYEHPYDQNPSTRSDIHQWGMVIDLNSCVGCSACVIACQGENNIPIVGKDQVARGREMHWMRIDRYWSHDPKSSVTSETAAEDPQMAIQPMFCQHCEAAPCESVCPVNATVHDEEGLNVMAYNRCIGTRYCANNCPYKVRRFNFFDYNKRESDNGKAQSQHILNIGNLYKGPFAENRNTAPEWEIVKLVKNPDVSVRMRGVMEKCTFCVQRIEQAKIARKVQVGNSGDVAVPDGTIQTACQQACPAEAIEFGNILDPDSRVSQAKRDSRNYSVLGFLDIRPRVTYLARVRNPNPVISALEGRDIPDSLRDYERHRHENPFDKHGHGSGSGSLDDGGERKGVV
jgi:Fe-S-cluster-containing dehydrogenase component